MMCMISVAFQIVQSQNHDQWDEDEENEIIEKYFESEIVETFHRTRPDKVEDELDQKS